MVLYVCAGAITDQNPRSKTKHDFILSHLFFCEAQHHQYAVVQKTDHCFCDHTPVDGTRTVRMEKNPISFAIQKNFVRFLSSNFAKKITSRLLPIFGCAPGRLIPIVERDEKLGSKFRCNF